MGCCQSRRQITTKGSTKNVSETSSITEEQSMKDILINIADHTMNGIRTNIAAPLMGVNLDFQSILEALVQHQSQFEWSKDMEKIVITDHYCVNLLKTKLDLPRYRYTAAILQTLPTQESRESFLTGIAKNLKLCKKVAFSWGLENDFEEEWGHFCPDL